MLQQYLLPHHLLSKKLNKIMEIWKKLMKKQGSLELH